MPAVYSSKSKLFEDVPDHLLVTLKDLVENISIQKDFSLQYRNYKPEELTAKSLDQLQKLPQKLQDKYLNLQLCSFLSGIYFTGSLHTMLSAQEETAELTQPIVSENSTLAGVDLMFFEQLHGNNCGRGYDDFGWQVVRLEGDDNLIIVKDELTLHIKRDRHLSPKTQTTAVGELISIRLPQNKVDSRNYIAISNAGSHEARDPNQEQQNVCIYFNFGAEVAAIFMAELTRQLNKLSIPFSFKVPYNPWDYERYDSGRLYFKKQDYHAVKSILKPIYLSNSDYFAAECPFLTKILAKGLALAEEPSFKLSEAESFSKNRCQIIANGLLQALREKKHLPDTMMTCILQEFVKNKVDLQKTYLNAQSQDIYFFGD